jgi:hypothetical protein
MIERIKKFLRDTTGMFPLAQRFLIELAMFLMLFAALWNLVSSHFK